MENQNQMCKRLKYKNLNLPESPTTIRGIIVSEDNHFVVFRTARRTYRISKLVILSIEDTDEPFQGVQR